MPPRPSGLSGKAVGWALLSQAIWLPLGLIAVHDRWLVQLPWPASGSRHPAAEARLMAPPLSLADLEKAAAPPSRRDSIATLAAPPAPPPAAPRPAVASGTASAAGRPGLLLRSPEAPSSRPPLAASGGKPLPSASPAGRPLPAPPASGARQAGLSRPGKSPSQLLGGSLALQDLPATPFQGAAPSRQGSEPWRPGNAAELPAPAVSAPSGTVRLPLGPSGREPASGRPGRGYQPGSTP